MNEITIKKFIDDLASDAPAPGGGGAAALTASIAASLCAMVFNLTIGKKIYEEYDEVLKEKINNELTEVDKLKDEMLTFIKKDAEAFTKLIDSYKLPKETEDEKTLRSEEIQNCYKHALGVPLGLAKLSMKLYFRINTAASYGNPNVISDAAVSAITIHGAVLSALINIKINLVGIKDKEFVKEIEAQCDEIKRDNETLKDRTLKLCSEKMGFEI